VRERREQIIAASVRLFSEKGFHKTTTREIARASGLSNGALYEYVKSKEDILFLVCQHIHHEMAEGLQQSLRDDHLQGAERLRVAIESFFHVIESMQTDVLLIYQESKSLPPAFLHEVLAEEQRITAVFERLLRQGAEDGSLLIEQSTIPLLAHDIVVMGQMWAYRRWALRDVPFATFVAQQVSMLMHACGAEGP
jgi:AcrR family transcriptional regulator